MSKFKAGDLVTVIAGVLSGEYVPGLPSLTGKDAVVVSTCHMFTDSLGNKRVDGIVLDVSTPGFYMPPERLAHRPPPSDCNQLTSWQECLWRPKETA